MKEIPSFEGIIGIALVVFGIYALKLQHAKEGFLQPFHHIRKNKAMQYMFLVILSSSLAGLFDKIGIVATNGYVYGLANYILISLSLFIIALVKARKNLEEVVVHAKSFLIIGAVVASYTLLNFVALQTGFAGYVGTVRASYILFTMIMGIVFLREKDGKQKLLASVFIILGLIFIKLFS